jgi:hypothetical protein
MMVQTLSISPEKTIIIPTITFQLQLKPNSGLPDDSHMIAGIPTINIRNPSR